MQSFPISLHSPKRFQAQAYCLCPYNFSFLHYSNAHLHFAMDLQVNNTSLEMTRRDLGNNIMELSHTRGKDRWLVIKKELDASHVRLITCQFVLVFLANLYAWIVCSFCFIPQQYFLLFINP